jgi:hypothetical protein
LQSLTVVASRNQRRRSGFPQSVALTGSTFTITGYR